MTDKQIIIDGVDVSGCIYFCDGYCNDNNDGFKCSLNSEHCYYKQLKRKEQECEELKERIDNIRDFAKQGRDMFVEQGSFADWYKVAECMKNDFNFILYEIDDEE